MIGHTYPRRPRRVHSLLALVTLSACTSYQVGPTDAITPGSQVRLRFLEPRSLVFQTTAGDSLLLNNIAALEGQLIARNADTITVVVSRARQANIALDDQLNQTTTRLALRGNLELWKREGDPGKTLLLVTGLLGALVAIMGDIGVGLDPSGL